MCKAPPGHPHGLPRLFRGGCVAGRGLCSSSLPASGKPAPFSVSPRRQTQAPRRSARRSDPSRFTGHLAPVRRSSSSQVPSSGDFWKGINCDFWAVWVATRSGLYEHTTLFSDSYFIVWYDFVLLGLLFFFNFSSGPNTPCAQTPSKTFKQPTFFNQKN
jgi:hypothetical protein